MAWNEPGKSPGKRNPWEKRSGKPTSGGLDELIKHFKKKFSSAPGGGASAGLVVAVLIVLALLWISTGMYQVKTGQVAVITRFGKFQRIEQVGRSLHLPWPIEDDVVINVADDEQKGQMRIVVSDKAFIDVVYALRFRRSNVVEYAFNVCDPDITLDGLTQSAIRESFAQKNLGTALSASRQVIANQARDMIQSALTASKAGIVVNSVEVIDVRVPTEVKSAQEDVTKAQSENSALIARAREYASDVRPKALGQAVVEQENAEAYKSGRVAQATGEAEYFLKLLPEYQRAPVVTRERIYLETMESIYKNSKKIVIDTKGSNIINIPLEKFSASVDHEGNDKPVANSTVSAPGRSAH